MSTEIAASDPRGHVQLVTLAREIALDLYGIEEILKRHRITSEQWGRIQLHPGFQAILAHQVQAWHSALNTNERVKLKSAIIVEEWLEEANRRVHDSKETLTAKTEVVKLLSRLAEMGLTNVRPDAGGEKFSVTINLGDDAKLSIKKEGVVTRVIEHDDANTPPAEFGFEETSPVVDQRAEDLLPPEIDLVPLEEDPIEETTIPSVDMVGSERWGTINERYTPPAEFEYAHEDD